jgi:pimeloyl-ACP methyl ester carboxylesterase
MPKVPLTGVVNNVYPARVRPATRRAADQAADDYGRPAEPSWREVDWKAHVRQTDVEGRAVHYVDIGTGDDPPVVFVHGLSGNWQNWLENIPFAAEGRRVVAMDLPGFGRSEMPREDISISAYARVVDRLCEQLGLGPVAVVGNSMGGFIGAELAIAFPERVERLVLLSAAGISSTNLYRRPTMTVARYTAALGALTASRSKAIVSRPRLRHAVLSPVMRHPTRLPADLLWEILQGSGRPGFVDALEALMTYDYSDRLPEIGCPTLVVWGREDMLVPVSDADEYERLIPDARKTVFDDTGHVAMLERPVAVNRCLASFLEEMGEARDNLEAEPVASTS